MNLSYINLYSASGRVPEYQTEGASGFDLPAYITESDEDAFLADDKWSVVLHPGQRRLIKTGLHFDIPNGYEIQIRPRSSMSLKFGILAMIGTIDDDYRGDVGVMLFNLSDEPYTIKDGARLAQGVLNQVPKIKNFVLVNSKEELSSTDRSHKGYGSTGI